MNVCVNPLPLGINSSSVGSGSAIATAKPPDTADVADGFADDCACTVTVYDPGALQACEAVVVPALSHPELVPSPQLNSYCTALASLEVAPLAE